MTTEMIAPAATETIEKRLTAWRLINSYQTHCNETGFLEWNAGTPDYVKQMQQRLFDTQTDWEKF